MKKASLLILLLLTISCNSTKLPTKKLSQYEYYKSYSLDNNILKIEIENPLNCPLRIWILNSDNKLQINLT